MKHQPAFAALALAVTLTVSSTIQAQPLPTAAPESAGFSSQRLANIDAFFKAEIERKRVPGAVVAIARQGKLCQRRLNIDPPCRSNIDPGRVAGSSPSNCG